MPKVCAASTTTFSEETFNPATGLRTAGEGQVTWFVLEEITGDNRGFWRSYCENKTKQAGIGVDAERAKIVKTAIMGFTNALEFSSQKCADVYVAYALLDLSSITPPIAQLEPEHVQMCMTVTTSENKDFFAVTHMGIFRNPTSKREMYVSHESKGIAIELHSFAAKALERLAPAVKAELMITAPMPRMGALFEGNGKLAPIDLGEDVAQVPPGRIVYAKEGERDDAELTVRYGAETKETDYWTEPWLFNLAFNGAHAFAPAFISYDKLKEQASGMTFFDR